MRRLLLAAVASLLLVGPAAAQSVPFPISLGTVWTPAQWIAAWQSKADVASNTLFPFGQSFPSSGNPVGGSSGGNLVAITLDGSGNLNVNCTTGCSGTLPAGAATAANQTSVTGSVGGAISAANSLLVGGVYNSSPLTLTNGFQASLQFDVNGYLKTNCTVGCSGGSTSNASDAVATSSTNGSTVSYNYGFNGTTWDRLQVDGSKNLKVVINGAITGGTNTIGKVQLLGNSGAALDAAGQNVASPANELLTGCQFNTSPATITNTNMSPMQCDNAGNHLVNLKTAIPAGTNLIGSVTSTLNSALTAPTSTLTRPSNTTPYTGTLATPQLVASSVTAGSVVVPTFAIANSGGHAVIPLINLTTTATTGWNGVGLIITLWTAAPTYTNGDGGTYAVATGSSKKASRYSCTLIQDGDGANCVAFPIAGTTPAITPAASTTVPWDVQIISTATPISAQTFTVTPQIWN